MAAAAGTDRGSAVTVGGAVVWGAAMCAGLAAALLVGSEGERLRRARLVVAGGVAEQRAALSWERWRGALGERVRPQWWCVPVAGVLAVLGESVIPLVAGAVAVPWVGRQLRAREESRERERRVERVIELCGALSGELRAGGHPGRALCVAAVDTGGLGGAEADVVAAARFGGDVPEALRRAAREPGAGGLVGIGVCWQVAVGSGAGLVAGLDRLEAALRDERDRREQLRSRLSGAWSTVGLLALLPVVGVLIGSAMGADPLKVLLHTPWGWGCLVMGGVLEAGGLLWARRIVRGGEGEGA
ncbi:type II secretion system F family protein [Streptomyces sp. CA-294286]|uniref:type II secretion system F family protein n=1 Tax=Streptomyces sp. CA-294286 TaxID=3240070 RepID=UPI003D8BA0FC